MLRTHVVVLALAVTMLAASGCGGSSKTGSATTAVVTTFAATPSPPATATIKIASGKPLTPAELIAKTDAICAGINAKRASITISAQKDYVRFVPPLGAYEQAAVAEMSKLVPPASMAHDWLQIADGVKTVAQDTAKIGQDAKENNLKAGGPLLSASTKILQQVNSIAKRDGFINCSKNS